MRGCLLCVHQCFFFRFGYGEDFSLSQNPHHNYGEIFTPKNRGVRKAVAKLVAEVHKGVPKIAVYGRQWPNLLQKYTEGKIKGTFFSSSFPRALLRHPFPSHSAPPSPLSSAFTLSLLPLSPSFLRLPPGAFFLPAPTQGPSAPEIFLQASKISSRSPRLCVRASE